MAQRLHRGAIYRDNLNDYFFYFDWMREMTIFDILMILALLCFMEARNCGKRAEIWYALADLEARKLDNPKDVK